jgi:hypothetical protein
MRFEFWVLSFELADGDFEDLPYVTREVEALLIADVVFAG